MALLLVKQQHALVHPVRPLEAPATQQAMFTACSQHVNSMFTACSQHVHDFIMVDRNDPAGVHRQLSSSNCDVRRIDSSSPCQTRMTALDIITTGQQRALAQLLKAHWGSCCPARYVRADGEQHV